MSLCFAGLGDWLVGRRTKRAEVLEMSSTFLAASNGDALGAASELEMVIAWAYVYLNVPDFSGVSSKMNSGSL